MTAIMYGTRYSEKYMMATGNSLAPGTWIMKQGGDTGYIINYKGEKQAVTNAAAKTLYPEVLVGDWRQHMTILTEEEIAKYPDGPRIDAGDPPAVISNTSATGMFKSNTFKYAAIGAAVIAGGFLLWKYRGKF